MGKAERRNLVQLFNSRGPGATAYDIILDNFWDVNDHTNPDELKWQHLWRVKAYFREAWDTRNVEAVLRVPLRDGSLPVLFVPTGEVLPEYPEHS